MKKLLAMLLSLVLALGMFAGVATAETTEGPWEFEVMASVTSDFGDVANQWLI